MKPNFSTKNLLVFVLLRVDATLGNGYRIWELEFAQFQGSEMYPELFQDLKDDSIEL